MIQLQQYTLVEKARDGSYAVIYSGFRNTDHAPVMVKILRSEYPEARDIAKLEHEYRILKDLDLTGVVKVLDLVPFDHGLALVTEDFGGGPLNELIPPGGLALQTALQIAHSLATTLASLHERHIVHKDIKPHNVVCNLDAGQVKIIDFGSATFLEHETQRVVRPDALEGTLAYMSPEQTGRMNREIDLRTDLYSLGVTLYEMLTGVLPFQTLDAMELVHSHIAKTPRSPQEHSEAIPKALSDIVMKLLSKAAEDRYQHAEGLAADIAQCLLEWTERGEIQPFPLGRCDTGDRLRIPQKLYGREMQLDSLLAAFERVSRGRSELLLVAGGAGVGKSALVHEIHKAIAQRGGDFIAGKFEELQRSVPFASFTQAFRDLIRQLLTEPTAKLAEWKARLLDTLGPNGQVLIDLIPELEIVIGPQPAVPKLGPMEAQNRFGVVFQNFVRVFCTPSHPLVVFLDDLQWADPASLSLFPLLLADPGGGYLLLVAAYRDREVDEIHPLRDVVQGLRKDGVAVEEVILESLDARGIRKLLGDTLGEGQSHDPSGSLARRLDRLAEHLLAKTLGNPFFLVQFLRLLHEQGLLRADRATGVWTWDEEAIDAAPITENVVEFMAGRIQKLSERTQRLLSLGACVGHRFDLATLSTIAEQRPGETAADLWPALVEGLLVPLDADYRLLPSSPPPADGSGGAATHLDVTYRFLHDRVQQAAYSLIEPGKQQELHLRIGRQLRKKLGSEPQAGALFDVVHHLNAGAGLMTDRTEQLDLARLDLSAGRMAKSSTAFAAAAGFFAAGIEQLGAAGWEDDAARAVAFALHCEQAECECLCRNYGQADALFETLLARAATKLEKVEVHTLRITHSLLQAKLLEGMAAGRTGLALFGVDLPETAEACVPAFGQELMIIEQNLAGRSIESLADAPLLTDPDQQALLRLLGDLSALAFWVDPRFAALIVAKQVSLSILHGHAGLSAFSYAAFGLMIVGALGRYAEGFRYGRLGLTLLEKLHATEMGCRVHVANGLFAAHHEPLRNTPAYFHSAQKLGFETGDFFYAAQALYHAPAADLRLGSELGAVLAQVERAMPLVLRTKDAMAAEPLLMTRQFIAALQGRTQGRTLLSDDTLDETEWIERMKAVGFLPVVFVYYIFKLQLAVMFGDYEGALSMAAGADAVKGSMLGIHWVTDLPFYTGLAIAGRYPAAAAEEQQVLLEALQGHQATLALLAESCPANELHRKALVAAEAARIAGNHAEAMDLYEQAIELARENGFPHHQAMALELCGKFQLSRGQPRVARVYMTEARYGYERWGAVAKAQQIGETYAQFLLSVAESPAPRTAAVAYATTTTGTTRFMPGGLLDVTAILKATQVIASEIVLEKLLDRLMRIVIANAGAQKAFLILNRGGRLVIEASVSVDPDAVQVNLSEPLEGSTLLATSVVQYVGRIREPVVPGMPHEDPRFAADPYIAKGAPKSIAVLPLLHRGHLTGVLYLENDAIHDAFPVARMEMLGLLSSQAAIALENAILYADLGAVSADLKRSNALLTAANEQLQKEFEERERLQKEHAAELEAIIQVQRDWLLELSTPMIPITDRIMVMPLIGTIDHARSQRMLETALHGVQETQARVVILDITGVKVVDTAVAATLIRMAAALRLLGTQVVLTGMRALVAQSLIRLGIDFSSIETRSTLKVGIAYALGQTGEFPAARPTKGMRDG